MKDTRKNGNRKLAAERQSKARKTRKIVAFELSDELFGADIEDVAEIMEPVSVMPLPNVPGYVLGLINLRGEILPVIDLRIEFGLEQKPLGLEGRIIVMKSDKIFVGVVVDRMWELLRLPEDSFKPPPRKISSTDGEYFKEVSEIKGRMLVVLDMKKILSRTANKGAWEDRHAFVGGI